MTWSCGTCGKLVQNGNEAVNHIIETSGHLEYKPNEGSMPMFPIQDLLHTMGDGHLDNCIENGLNNVLRMPHPNRDFISLYCSGMTLRKCPIDGKNECKLEFEDNSKIGYHEFRSIGNMGHHFSMCLNLPLIEILFSKYYPSIISKLRADIETEEDRFKKLEAEGKAFKIGHMQFGVPEGDSWNVVTQCKKCSKWQKLPMLVSKPPQNMPQNLFSMGFACPSCGEKYQITPKDCLDRSEWQEYLIKILVQSNPKVAEQFSELVNPNAKSNNRVYG